MTPRWWALLSSMKTRASSRRLAWSSTSLPSRTCPATQQALHTWRARRQKVWPSRPRRPRPRTNGNPHSEVHTLRWIPTTARVRHSSGGQLSGRSPRRGIRFLGGCSSHARTDQDMQTERQRLPSMPNPLTRLTLQMTRRDILEKASDMPTTSRDKRHKNGAKAAQGPFRA